jgi:hypothetical protein
VIDNIIGGGQRAAGPVPRTLGKHHNGDIAVSEQDPDRAVQALEDSSYTREEINSMDVQLWDWGSPTSRQTCLLFQSNVKEILGLDFSVKSSQWKNVTEAATDPTTAPHFSFI